MNDRSNNLQYICRYIIDAAVPSLNKITMKIRSNIIRGFPSNHDDYSKPHAVAIVTQYNKYSKERASIIKELVDDRRVPSRKALDKQLKMKENDQFIVDDRWTGKHRRCYLQTERIASITNTTGHMKQYRINMVEQIRKQKQRQYQRGAVKLCKPTWECRV